MLLKIFIFLMLAGCATGLGNGKTVLREYNAPIFIYGDGN